MSINDEEILTAIKSELDGDLDRIDSSILKKLQHSRREALAQSANRRLFAPRIAPALAFVTSVVVFIVLLRVPGFSISPLGPDAVLSELEFVESEIELVDELEFFRWLDANGHAG